jgi:pimeloyl-ACP methyl ester carboxylesterase
MHTLSPLEALRAAPFRPARRIFEHLAAALAVSGALALSLAVPKQANAAETAMGAMQASDDLGVHYRTQVVDGVDVFYREAGPKTGPTVLLLHGFPTSSHMFRTLIPALADKYHVVAPDLPGFGWTRVAPGASYTYNFANLAETIAKFTEALGLKTYAVYVFDYGAPVGLRLALRNPERITAIISQNGNAYEEGLNPEGWNPVQAYWKHPTAENREVLRSFLKPEAIKWQYTHGAPDPSLVARESYTLDQVNLDAPGNADIQLDLFGDYQSNVALYPKFQEYLRTRKPPLLAIWGKNDPFFLPAGAEAYKRDNPEAEVRLLDAGHFALETNGPEIAAQIRAFLGRTLK